MTRIGARRGGGGAWRWVVLLGAVSSPAIATAAVPREWVQPWRDDLALLRRSLPEAHANAFHTLPRDSFEARVDRLSRAVPELDHHQIVAGIAELVAGVRDGHTRLTLPVDPAAGFFRGHAPTPAPKIGGLTFHALPVRLYLYEDGLFVRRAGASHAAAAGSRVLRIGRMTAAEAMKAVEPVVQRDNDAQVRHLLPDFLVVPEVLHARGVTDDPRSATLELETPGGVRTTLRLAAGPPGDTVRWVDARDPAKPVPLHQRDPDSNYWFEYLRDERIVYMQYNTVYDRADETIDAFTDRLLAFVEREQAEALVIDLRGNPGGNNARNLPLLKGLIRCARLQPPGRLFVIVGRGTFSAAMMLAVDLEKYTNAIFVGEPTGASPNGYGDSRKLTLPNSGLTVRVSTLRWQYSGPRDDRPAIAPHVPAPLRSDDYRAGRDPALEAVRRIVAGPARAPAPGGTLAGRLHAGAAAYPLSLAWDATGARLSIPALGLDAAPAERLTRDDRRIAFEVPREAGAMRLEGRWMGGWMIGDLDVPAAGKFLLLIPPVSGSR